MLRLTVLLSGTIGVGSLAGSLRSSTACAPSANNWAAWRRISSMITDVAYSCSNTAGGTYSIDWMIGSVEKITGYSMEEVKAQGFWQFLVVDKDLPLFEKSVTGLAPGSSGSCELRLRKKSGDIVWVASFAQCVVEPANPEPAQEL